MTEKERPTNDVLALRRFEELNPRFPSVQSPLVGEQQWKFRSALLPPDVSTRFVGAEVPKKYRDGHFSPLLRADQAASVNRLHLSPRAPPDKVLYHPLSRKFADVELRAGAARQTPASRVGARPARVSRSGEKTVNDQDQHGKQG